MSQVSLLLLLYGTIIGDFALLADVGARAVGKLTPHPPELLVGHGGRGMMVLLALCPVLPLCLLRRCPTPRVQGALTPILLYTLVGHPPVVDGCGILRSRRCASAATVPAAHVHALPWALLPSMCALTHRSSPTLHSCQCACFARKQCFVHATFAEASCGAPKGKALRCRFKLKPRFIPTRMRSLETAATAGVVIVLALAGIIVAEALRAGLPAIASGELPLWRLQARAQVSRLASP